VLSEIELLTGRTLSKAKSDWRAGDQLYFVADTRAIADALGWRAAMPWREGLRDLYAWLHDDRSAVSRIRRQPRRVTA
jgi:CDP-paratose 2-epimerase